MEDISLSTPVVEQEKGKKSKTLLFIFIATTILSLIALVTLGYLYLQEMKSQGKNIFTINSVDPSIANKLSGAIVYSSDKSENADYFSPSLELTFKYNEKVLTMSEGSSYISVMPKEWEIFSTGYLKTTPTSDIKGFFLANNLYTDLEVKKEENKDGIGYILFSYSQKSLLDDSKTTKSLSVVYKQLEEGKSAYFEIREYDYQSNTDVTNALVNILKTISTDLSGIDQNIQAQIDNGTVKISFDRSNWTIGYQSDTSLSLFTTSNSDASINMYLMEVYSQDKVKDTQALRAQLTQKITDKRVYFDGKGYPFEVLGDATTVEIGGLNFEKMAYRYNYGSEPYTIETIYVGYVNGKQKQLDMTTRYYSDKEESSKLIEDTLKTITIDNTNIYSIRSGNVLGDSSVSINSATILGQASTVRIFTKECDTVSFSSSLTGFNVAGKSYQLCTAGLGSGFVVNNEGHIVTNAHVADPNDFDVLVSGYSLDGQYEKDFGGDFIDILSTKMDYATYQSLSDDQLEYLLFALLQSIDEKGLLTITPYNSDIYIQGTEAFDINPNTLDITNADKHYKAELVKSNKISSSYKATYIEEENASDISDLALLKTDTLTGHPSLPISSITTVAGQNIFVIGYPGLVDNSKLIDTSALLSSTVTAGTVSAIKPNSNNTFDLLQIDASVDHGNSGGPIINSDGELVGVATYGIASSSSGNYNAGVSSEEVSRFLSEASISMLQNDERKMLESAMKDISKSYYSRAQEKLENILSDEGSLSVIIGPFIELCEAKVADGEDKSPILDLGLDAPILMVVVFVILVLLLIVSVVILVLMLKAKSQEKSLLSNTKPQVL